MRWQTLDQLRRAVLGQLRPGSAAEASGADAGPTDDEARLAAVGATAVTVAICRAAERERVEPWFIDPLADYVARTAEPTRATNPRPGLIFWVAVRTRFLDELVASAVADGVRQVVLLGAGLDARAIRLELPDDVTFFEVDRSSVHELKSRLLRQAGLTASRERRTVVADLASSDWLAALRAQGWTSAAPTCWIAEGLLIYLKPEPRDTLLREVANASAQGSRLGVTATSSTRAAQVGIWESGIDGDVAQWMAGLGWSAVVSTLPEAAAAFGRPVGVETERARSAILIDARPIRRPVE
jgi:methyltransferase (TIGR00027 family)